MSNRFANINVLLAAGLPVASTPAEGQPSELESSTATGAPDPSAPTDASALLGGTEVQADAPADPPAPPKFDHLPPHLQPKDPPEHILQYFAFAHLPPHLQDVSRPFAALADDIVANVPRNPERTVALRKLLESKDAAVRAKLAKV